jgi:hypothetical protein
VTGYLDIHGARQFLGNKSVSWIRSHISEIPHRKLYSQLLFCPLELRVWVEATAERHTPVDVDAVVAEVMKPRRKGRAAR